MGNGDSKNSDGKPVDPAYIPFSEFKFFDEFETGDQASEATPDSVGTEPGKDKVPDAVVDVLEGRLSNPHREAMLKNLVAAKPKIDPNLTPKNAVALKKYPHVLAKLDAVWGIPELFHIHLSRFSITEERVDPKDPSKIIYNREGFPPEVANELLALRENHDRLFGPPPQLDVEANIKIDPYSHSNSR